MADPVLNHTAADGWTLDGQPITPEQASVELRRRGTPGARLLDGRIIRRTADGWIIDSDPISAEDALLLLVADQAARR